MLLHQGSAGIGGTAVDIELQADDLRHTRDTVLRSDRRGHRPAVDRVFEDSLHDHWYTAEEALDYGFIDTIVSSPSTTSSRAARERRASVAYDSTGGARMSSYTIPNVIAQNPRGERIMDVYSHLLTERIIYLGTPIDAGVANALIAQLLHLESDNPDRDIQLYINCEGGDPSAMLAVYDTMRFIRPQVATTCVGQAVAVGAVLLAAGAEGKRAALPHTRDRAAPARAAQGRGDDPRPDPAGGRGGAGPGGH